MKNYKFYLYTAVSFILFFVLVSIISIPYLLKINGSVLLESNIASGKSEMQHMHQFALINNSYIKRTILQDPTIVNLQKDLNITERQIDSIISKRQIDSIIPIFQNTVKNTESELLFLSVLDWQSQILCHPDRTKVRLIEKADDSDALTMENSISGIELYNAIYDSSNTKDSKVIYIQSIPDLGLIIASNINIENFKTKINTWKTQLYFFILILGLLILLMVFGAIRVITGYYQNQLDQKNTRLEDGVLNLSKLNASLDNYQKKLNEIAEIKTTTIISQEDNTSEETIIKEKARILTYVRNELVPISTEDIAYIYVENTITYIVRKDGKRATASESLDQIYSYLNEKSFFRANRQIIVAISAIDKITKFGNSQLKIQVNPASEIDIIIGKNKASAFKQWLDL